MKSFSSTLNALRTHRRSNIFVLAAIAVSCLPILAFGDGSLPWRVHSYWITVSVAWIALAAVWSFGVGAVARAWREVARSATALAAIGAFGTLASTMRASGEHGWGMGVAEIALIPLGWFVMYGLAAVITGTLGAALCAAACRRRAKLANTPGFTLAAFWAVYLALYPLFVLALHRDYDMIGVPTYFQPRWQSQIDWDLVSVTPIVTWLGVLATERFAGSLLKRAQRVWNRVLLPLVVGFTWRRRRRVFDVRGLTVGLFAGVVALAITSIASGLREYAAAAGMAVSSELFGTVGRNESGSLIRLHMDASVLADIEDRRSEAAVQADIIRALSTMGAKRVVLVAPHVERRKHEPGFPDETWRADEPDAGSDANRRDLPKLIAAVRNAGNVTLDLDAGGWRSEFNEHFYHGLAAAAREAAHGGLNVANCGTQLMIDLRRPGSEMPLPFVLDGISHGWPTPVHAPGDYHDAPAFRRLKYRALTSPIGVAVCLSRDSFLASRPSDISYLDVLRNRAVWGGQRGKTIPARVAIKNRIVFLDIRRPAGRHAQPEFDPVDRLVAATNTLVTESGVQGLPSWLNALIALAFSVAVGALSLGRSPLSATGRTLMAVAALDFAICWALFQRYWVDPSAPLIGACVTLVMTLQLNVAITAARRSTPNASPRI